MLVIELKPTVTVEKASGMKLRLTVKELRDLRWNGAGSLVAKNLAAESLKLTANGSAGAKLAGKVTRLSVTQSGTGTWDLADLDCQRATVTNSGAGLVIVKASEQLNATVYGVGSVEYIGHPKLTTTVYGTGAVRQR
jgi:hypothetical protein